MAEDRKTDDIDRHVGDRIRMRRIMVGTSQDELGKKLGITFQQIQKYEKGANRISAGRLYRAAQILDVPVSFFFEGLPSANGRRGKGALPEYLTELMGTSLGQRLVEGLGSITEPKMRYGLLQLIEGIQDQHEQNGRKRKASRPILNGRTGARTAPPH
jgi:transcriptional regulator with XRE-family HTH domain